MHMIEQIYFNKFYENFSNSKRKNLLEQENHAVNEALIYFRHYHYTVKA